MTQTVGKKTRAVILSGPNFVRVVHSNVVANFRRRQTPEVRIPVLGTLANAMVREDIPVVVVDRELSEGRT